MNSEGRFAGLTHDGDHGYKSEEQRKFVEQAMEKRRELLKQSRMGHLVNFQEVMKAQTVSLDVSHSRFFSNSSTSGLSPKAPKCVSAWLAVFGEEQRRLDQAGTRLAWYFF